MASRGSRGTVAADVREQIMLCVDAGASLAEVECGLIDPAPQLSEDERAGLWLFAWAYVEIRPRREDGRSQCVALKRASGDGLLQPVTVAARHHDVRLRIVR